MANPPYGPGAGVPLIGDGVTQGIVRIGNTVRRPIRPMTATVQAYLRHLHGNGFTDVPMPLGRDGGAREVLSFVPGDLPAEPLPAWCGREDVLVALARLIRRLHRAPKSWEPPAGAICPRPPNWLATPTTARATWSSAMGLPAALIDFDLAKPTTRLAEVANALRYWAPLCDPRDRPPAFREPDVPHRVWVFADAYGLDGTRRIQLVPLLVGRARSSLAWAETAAGADPVFRGFWENGWRESMPRAVTWLENEGRAIEQALVW
jgi:hypothetical protein